jgi:cephalosporin hydroxylase
MENKFVAEQGVSSFLGFKMQQNLNAVPAFSQLFAEVQPVNIIEIGTGCGGLSVFLALARGTNGGIFETYDSTPAHFGPFISKLGGTVLTRDLTEPAVQEQIAMTIGLPGTSLVLCDGLDKAGEFNLFAPHLKVGDIIMAHDYAETSLQFEQEIRGRYWNWCEITECQISETCLRHGLEPFMQSVFKPAVWACRRKIR